MDADLKSDVPADIRDGRTMIPFRALMEALDVAPYAMDGRTFVPLRFVSEQLGFRVTYDPATRAVHISG